MMPLLWFGLGFATALLAMAGYLFWMVREAAKEDDRRREKRRKEWLA